uniref:UPAR/Ly6 domain-containing protein n=1 Tax=Clytia hemisphaerica TaxID=252671 RepID=A0A7M6DMY1_9CNID|eukprot:TCONS_00046901-protein
MILGFEIGKIFKLQASNKRKSVNCRPHPSMAYTCLDTLLAMILFSDWMRLGDCLSCYDCGMSSSSKACNNTQLLKSCSNTNQICITARYYEQLGNTFKYVFFKGCMKKSFCENYCNKLPFDATQCMSKCCQKDKCNALSNERWVWYQYFQSDATRTECQRNIKVMLVFLYLLTLFDWLIT